MKMKILGIGMTIIMLVSLFGIAGVVTVSAAGPGDQEWDYITEPYDSEGYKIAKVSKPIDFAFNGTQGYMIEYGYGTVGAGTTVDTRGRVFRSANSGQSWSHKSAWQAASKDAYGITGNATVPAPVAIAVAPDDKLSIAVTDGAKVFISSNEGDTWSLLPALTLGAGQAITDIAVAPARSGLLLAREYAITVANTGTGVGGDVLILGSNATWTPAGGSSNSNLYDYGTLQFSPNYVGDRTLVAVGANATNFVVQEFKTTSNTVLYSTTVATTTAGAIDIGGANQVAAADLALPTDFDPTTTTSNQLFVSVASTGITGGVFRVTPSDATVTTLLSTDITSIAYSGTNDTGTLFAGYYSSGDVKRCDDPMATSPSWHAANKNTTGTNVKVRLDSSYAFNTTVYAMTSTDSTTVGRSAFAVSTDNGLSFDQYSMIDYANTSTLGNILDFQVTSDESHTFYLTNDKGNATLFDGSLHLWDAPGTQPTSTQWIQKFTIVKTSGSNNPGLLAVNPDYATTPAIYIVDNSGTGASTVYVSQNGGATWSTRTGPGSAPIDAFGIADANTVFASIASSVYTSTNAGWTWGDAVSASSLSLGTKFVKASSSEILLGGKGRIFSSTNNGGTWSSNSLGLDSTQYYYPAVDANYATNKTYFVAGTDGSVWRRAPSDTAWLDVSPAATDPYSNTTSGNLVRVATTTPRIAFGTNALYVLTLDGVLRNTDWQNQNPSNVSTAWEKMDAGTTVQNANNLDYQGNLGNMNVYGGYNVIVSTPLSNTFSYRDFISNNAPTLSGPDDGVEVSIDPNTGLGLPVTFEWDTMGTGSGVPTAFQIEFTQVGSTTKLTTVFGVSDIANPAINSADIGGLTLRANTEYTWRLRVRNELSGDAVRSAWSATRTIKVLSGTQVIQTQAGPVLQQVTSPSSLRPGFSWAPVASATEYQFILATDAALTQTVAGTPALVTSPAFSLTSDLLPNTTYFWAVKLTKPTVGVQSIGNFTTAGPGGTVTGQPTYTFTVPPITVPQSTVTVEPGGTTINPALVWVVIVIGAILIIAVLVLIVRTRRPV